jgi:hypothetical protein
MSYIYGVRSPSNLGRLGFRPNQAASRIFAQRAVLAHKRRARLTGLRGHRLGQTDEDFDLSDPLSSALNTSTFSVVPAGSFDPNYTLTASGLPASVVDQSLPITPQGLTTAAGYSSLAPTVQPTAYDTLVASLQNSSSPLDYTTPAAAVAGGVAPATVIAAWSTPQGVNSFSSPQAATAALTAVLGASAAAAQVAKLWTGGGQTLPMQQPSFFSGSTAGIPNTLLVGGLALLVVVAMSGGGGGGRR